MPEPDRARLISVVGGESTGKSTLATALGDRLPATVVPEFLRRWVDRHGRVPLAAEQVAVMSEHRESEVSALLRASRTPPSWVVSDSGPLMTAVYSIQYYGDTSLLPTALEWTAQSARVVWCQDDFPWQPEPQRDGSHARSRSQKILATIFAENPGLPVLAVRGSLEDRVETVLDHVGTATGRDGGAFEHG
ncbi:MAG: ATP-binding protein [Mycobacterium sp.]|nr:ATP-binding protein [Mycobacterium sp.]